MRLFGIVEILLRNRFHVALSKQYWRNRSSRGYRDSNDWFLSLYRPYAPLQRQNEGHKKIRKKLGPQNKQATPTQVIAGHHQRAASYWRTLAHQDSLYARMNLVGALRNRVAHFEPLWKFGDEKEELRERGGIVPATVTPAPSTVVEALDRMRRSYQRTTQLLHWLSQSRAVAYSQSENHQALLWLMGIPGFEHFRSLPAHREVRLCSLARNWDLKSTLRSSGFVLVTDKGNRVGRYYADPC